MGHSRSRQQFGLVIVGNEILNGTRQDRHFAHVARFLEGRGSRLAWVKYVGDDRAQLAETLQHSQLGEDPVISIGGIGATPDDLTRIAAADAFGTRLVRHVDAQQLIETEFGDEAYPHRILMAELPEACLLIPNPVNRIPGFTVYDHHFLPGFPAMAWPMLEWVMDTYYPHVAEPDYQRSVRIYSQRESDLLPLMNSLVRSHAAVSFFSLPHMGESPTIEFGFRGNKDRVIAALQDLCAVLEDCGYAYDHLGDAGQTEVLATGFTA